MKFIIGKKIDMTQIWQGEKVIAVTRVQAGPCPIVQLKDAKSDGYSAVQLGFGERKEKNINQAQKGHLKKAKILSSDGKTNLRFYREFRDEIKDLKVGDIVNVTTFQAGDEVKVTGTSKGKGFQGNVRRHHFHGHNATHGTKDQVRTSGSIGAGGPQHVFKGLRMPGRMGNQRSTTGVLKIVQIDEANNILYVSGALPGARNSVVMIYGEGELKIAEPKAEVKVEEVKPAEQIEVVAEAKVETAEAKPEAVEEKKEEAAEVKAETK